MGKLIGSGNTENFGEKVFIDKAQEYLDDTCGIRDTVNHLKACGMILSVHIVAQQSL